MSALRVNWRVSWCMKGVMVRLMLVLAPVMCILSGIAVSSTLTTYMKNLDVSHKDKKSRKQDVNYPLKNEVLFSTWHAFEFTVLIFRLSLRF